MLDDFNELKNWYGKRSLAAYLRQDISSSGYRVRSKDAAINSNGERRAWTYLLVMA